MKKHKKTLVIALSLILVGLSIGINNSKEDPIERMSYNEYTELVENNGIDVIYYSGASEYMTVALTSDETKKNLQKKKKKNIITTNPT